MKEYLKKKKITQAEFATLLGVSQRLVAYWCAGEREPNATMMIKIAHTLGVTVERVVMWFAEDEANAKPASS